MRARHWRTFWLAALLSLSMPGVATACLMAYVNPYKAFAQRASPAALYAKAAFIDWVSIEPPGPPRCPQWPTAAEDGSSPGSTDAICGRFDSGGYTYPFVARSLEHLKGWGEDFFPLAYAEKRWDQQLFFDPRSIGVEDHIDIAAHDKAVADTRHTGPWLTDHFTLEATRFGMCIGFPSLEPHLSYLVFRNSAGFVIGLQAADAEDDLLRRLRRRRADRDALIQQADVAEFFRSADGLVLVETGACREGGLGELWVKPRVLRGSTAALGQLYDGQGHYLGPVFNFLWEWSQYMGRPCSHQQFLVVIRPFRDRTYVGSDVAWIARIVSDMPKESADILARSENQLELAEDVERPAIVRNGRVRRRDLLTAVRLAGPDSFSVDQAFAWFQEGAAERERRHPEAQP